MEVAKHPRPVFAGPTAPSMSDPVHEREPLTSQSEPHVGGWLARVLRRLFG
jgi:hypothetical protein